MEETVLNRRHVLTGSVIAALAALWKPGEAFAAEEVDPEATVTVDVAYLGGTLTADAAAARNLGGGNLHGAGFLVEGNLYSGGTLPAGEGFDPASVAPVGHWLCRGWMMFYPERPVPHAISTQEFLFGRITADQVSPADQLTTSGVEGGVPTVIRSVIGGTGRYRGARGEVIQQVIGTNTTVINGFGMPAPNLRFSFKL
jgi:hypothetical protein